MADEQKRVGDFVVFHDKKLESKYRDAPSIPMSTLYEAYFDGAVDIPGDLFRLLQRRHLFVKYTLTQEHLKWAVTNFVPEVSIHSKAQDERLVREHYDRGNEFFRAFLGDRMAYTSALFQRKSQSLEAAIDNQLESLGSKLQLKNGDRVLDLGCGFGAFTRFAARQYGADVTGVTISENEAAYANGQIAKEGLGSLARVLQADYRELPELTAGAEGDELRFDKIACIEMVEHVGWKNLGPFFESLRDLLDDQGLLLLQWTGLKRGLDKEEMIWGLFMNRYIFPGADASLPPSSMLKALEKAGFEARSLENHSLHFTWTLERWHDNWKQSQDDVVERYGERWYRIWNFFLAWSRLIGAQGSAASYQIVVNKNLRNFDRSTLAPGLDAPHQLRSPRRLYAAE